jgi:hypothetical protein
MNRRRFLRTATLASVPAVIAPAIALSIHEFPDSNSNREHGGRRLAESESRIQRATAAALAMQRRDWEQGILAQAMLQAGDSERVNLLTKAAILQQTPDGRMMRTAARAKMDAYGYVQGVCSAPNFDRAGTSTEGQAFCILMEAAGRSLSKPRRSLSAFWMPAQPIEYPTPCCVGSFLHWRLRQTGFRIAHRLASVCIRNLLEDVALPLDTSVIR